MKKDNIQNRSDAVSYNYPIAILHKKRCFMLVRLRNAEIFPTLENGRLCLMIHCRQHMKTYWSNGRPAIIPTK